MLNAKQRSFLKSLANTTKPLAQLGKDGITESFLTGLNELFENHELVKVSVLESNLLDAKDAAIEVAEKTGADFVQAIGKKFVLYRPSTENPKIVLPVDKNKEKADKAAAKLTAGDKVADKPAAKVVLPPKKGENPFAAALAKKKAMQGNSGYGKVSSKQAGKFNAATGVKRAGGSRGQ